MHFRLAEFCLYMLTNLHTLITLIKYHTYRLDISMLQPRYGS